MQGNFFLLWQQAAPTPAPQNIAEVFARLHERALAIVPGLITGAIVFAIFFIIASTGRRLIAVAAPRARADTGAVLLLSRVFYYGVLTVGLLTALPATGLDVSALVAGLGLTGFALGFALKDVLSNLLSGIMLLLYRPFNIGDQIAMGAFRGTIETIRMRDTILRGYDGRLIIIPNTKLITEVVVNNRTARLARQRIDVTLDGDGQDETVAMARETLLRALDTLDALRGHVEPVVRVKQPQGEGDPVRLTARYWFDPLRAGGARLREDAVRSVDAALREGGIRAKVTTALDPNPTIAPESAKEPAASAPEESDTSTTDKI